MPGRVKTTATKTLITDVPSFSYSDGRDSLVLAAQAALRALGREEPYAMLKGLSALAFRFLFPTDWRRYTPDALAGFDHTALLFGPLGLRVETAGAGSLAFLEDSRRMIVESIGKGYPVLALHLMEWEDWGVIAGFGDGGKKLYCRTPHDGAPAEPPADETGEEQNVEPGSRQIARRRPYSRHQNWPNMLLVITGEQPAPERLESIRTSLHTAVELYDAGQYGAYYSGKQSYLHWVEGLRDSAWYAAQGEPDENGYAAWFKRIRRTEKDNIREDRAYTNPYLERAHVNAWRLESLIDARIAAASYLNNIALEYFKGAANTPARMHLQQAALRYNWLVAQLISIRPFVLWDDELDQAPWTQPMRERQADLLSSARFIEEQGVVEIRAALEEIEKGPSPI
jgi:hypothetical protein